MELDLSNAVWRKSSRSGAVNNCVEVARNLPQGVAVRDSKRPAGPALVVTRAAWHAFARLRMRRTRDRNAVLIFLAPDRRQLAVIGDVGLDGRAPPTLLNEVTEGIVTAFHRGSFTNGLVEGIERLAGALACAFPSVVGKGMDELPNTVVLLNDD